MIVVSAGHMWGSQDSARMDLLRHSHILGKTIMLRDVR